MADMDSEIFKFYSTKEYFRQLTESISLTVKGDRVVLATSTFDPTDQMVAGLMDQLIAASKRGVRTKIIIDNHTFTYHGLSVLVPFEFSSVINRAFSPVIKSLEEFKSSGGQYSIINKPNNPFSLIYTGRYHAKIAIINNRVYVGGCNLFDSDWIDMMVGWDDEAIADRLAEICDKIPDPNYRQAVFNGRDSIFEINKSAGLIFDAGIKNQSAILEKALGIIDSAEETIFFTCQYYPNSITTEHLINAAKRGVKVSIMFNHPSKHQFPNSLLHRLVMFKQGWKTPDNIEVIKLPKSENYLHSKLIATEKAAIVGSHNFIMAGVNFGTTEIALHVNSPVFASRAIKTVTDQLTSVSN